MRHVLLLWLVACNGGAAQGPQTPAKPAPAVEPAPAIVAAPADVAPAAPPAPPPASAPETPRPKARPAPTVVSVPPILAPPVPGPILVVPGTTVPLASSDADAAYGCKTNSDCRTSTLVDGSCCRLACGEAAAYNASYIPKLSAFQQTACDGHRSNCLAMGCAREEYHAVCVDGRCRAVKGF
jgi:hypothetical protein